MASMPNERWKPLVGTPSKPAIPSNILVPDPSPARSEVSDTDSPTLLPPSPVSSFIHQRRQGQYVPRPPVWKIDSLGQHDKGLIKAGACGNSLQEKATKLDWVLPLPGSDQRDVIQLMADAFNEEPLIVNILTLPETGRTSGIPSTEAVAASGAYARELDVHDTLHTSVEQAQSPNETPQANQENHDPLKRSAVEISERKLAKRHAELFTNPNPFTSEAQSAQPPRATEADPERPNGPFGMYPAGEAAYIDTDGVDEPVLPYDSVSNFIPRSSRAGDTTRSQALTSYSYPLSLSRTEEVVIGSQDISLEVQMPLRGVLKAVRLNVKVVPGRYTAHGRRSLEGKGGDTQHATKVLGKFRGSLGRFRQKITRGKVGSLKFSKRHPEYIDVNSLPSDPRSDDPLVPAPASQHSFSDALTSGSQYPADQQAAQTLGTFFEETGSKPVPRSGNVLSTYQPTSPSDEEEDVKTLLPPTPREGGGYHHQVETDHGQSQDRSSLPPRGRSLTRKPIGTQQVPMKGGENSDWRLPSPTGERADLPRGIRDENERFEEAR